jgi:hypothetical protein
MEANHRVVRVCLQRVLYKIHQSFRDWLPIQHELTLEKPVAAVLTVRLCNVKKLNIRGVSLDIIMEELCIILARSPRDKHEPTILPH